MVLLDPQELLEAMEVRVEGEPVHLPSLLQEEIRAVVPVAIPVVPVEMEDYLLLMEQTFKQLPVVPED